MNRLACYFEEPPEQSYGDFYVVAGEFGAVCVTREVAEYVERILGCLWVPAWVEFRDRVGSRVRVRTRHIRSICESTAAHRAADRRLERARQHEERTDRRPWEDGD